MTLAYKFRIYPNREVRHNIDNTLDLCRFTYNQLLEKLNEARKQNLSLTKVQTQSFLLPLKEQYPQLKNVYSKTLQMVNYKLWSNISGLSASKKKGRKVGKLRFKGKQWYKTIDYNQSGFKVDFQSKKISFSKIGTMPIKIHRPVKGNIKGILLKKEGCNYYAILQTDHENKRYAPKTYKFVGLDVGLSSFITDSDGNVFEHPKFMDKTLHKIRRANRAISRKKQGSKNRQKAKSFLVRVYDRLMNQRKDYIHKVSNFYISNYDNIYIEDFHIGKLSGKGKSRAIHRNIMDSSWGLFRSVLVSKAESAGKLAKTIPSKDTTQKCSRCGTIVRKTLYDRTHNCYSCGFHADRDYNASVNILSLGQGLAFSPVESEPLLRKIPYGSVISGQVGFMNQEAPSLNL